MQRAASTACSACKERMLMHTVNICKANFGLAQGMISRAAPGSLAEAGREGQRQGQHNGLPPVGANAASLFLLFALQT